MSWLEEALADLQGVTRYTKDELEEMGYVHKEFSDELSPEFQEAVEESTKKVQEFSVYLHEIGFDGIMTQEETDGFTKRVNGICDEVISTIENRKEEAQSGLKDLFIADDQVIDESEQKVLELLSQSSDAQISEVQTLQGEILAIQQNAANEKRQLNEQEIADIQSKNERIRQIELEALGGTEQEILYAKMSLLLECERWILKVHRNFYKRKRRSEMMKSYRFKRPTTQKYSYCRVNLAHARKKIGRIMKNRSQI